MILEGLSAAALLWVAPATYGPVEPAPAVSSVWDAVAECESGGDWQTNTGNGYYGGIQWSAESWEWWKDPDDPPRADLATPQQQIAAAERYVAWEREQGRGGFGPWPGCARKLGLPR